MTEVMAGTLTEVEGPRIEPIDLYQAKRHIKFSPSTEDTLIDGWISAARQYFEEQTDRQLMAATWEWWLPGFPCGRVLELPKPPLQSVVSVSYVDGAGITQTLVEGTDYVVKAPEGPRAPRGWIELMPGRSWPSTQCQSDAVRVRFVAGYGDAPGSVPELARTVLFLLVGHLHKFRAETHEGKFGNTATRLAFGTQLMIRGFRYTALPRNPPERG